MADEDNGRGIARTGVEARTLKTPAVTLTIKRSIEPRWLLLALLAHALLLCLPLARHGESARMPRAVPVQLSLMPPPHAPDLPDAREPSAKSELAVAPALPPLREATTRAANTKIAEDLREDKAPEDVAPRARLSTARLMDFARSSHLPPTSESGRTLGSAPSRSANAITDNPRARLGAALTRSYAPPAPEIVDRWLAADGSHQVVVRLPNGDTVCGRGEAWDPLRPLVEPVMMFRGCGGGGGRSFTMSADARSAYSMPD